MDWVGARWWKFDFHCHTPASEDYGKGPDQENLRSISPKDWLLNHMRAGIDCVAVTDHNSGGWVDLLKRALDELSSEGHPEFRQLFIFPGVEISAIGGIHILAIFGPEKTTSDIDTLLGAVNFRGEKGSCNESAEMGVAQIVDQIVDYGGIAIPAHADHKFSGLFSSLDDFKQVSNRRVYAMEVIDKSFVEPTLYHEKKLGWSKILGSDSHRPNGTVEERFPGSHFTWVKMSTPSLNGLILALLDGELSLLRSDDYPNDPNTRGDLMIEQITVNNAKYLGRANEFTCRFNPWLNSVIGGRGTGKSTTLELLRNALQRENEIPETLQGDFARYREVSRERSDEGLLTNDTSVTVYYRKDESRYKVDWTIQEGRKAYEESDGEWLPTPGSINQRFPIRIYSQKQIFELAKSPDSLLRIIDDSPQIGYEEWKRKWDELSAQYLSIRAKMREIQTGLDEEETIKGELADVRRKLDIFQKAGHEKILKDYHARDNQKKALDSWEDSWANWSDDLGQLTERIVFTDIDFGEHHPGPEERHELDNLVVDLNSKLEDVRLTMEGLKNQLDFIKDAWQIERPRLKLTANIVDAKEKYDSLVSKLEEERVGVPSAYSYLIKEEQRLKERLRELNEKKVALKVQDQEADNCLAQLMHHRVALTRKRTDFLNTTLSDNEYVQIQVIPYGNKELLEDQFRGLIDRGNGGFDTDINSLLSELMDSDEPQLSQINKVKESIVDIYQNEFEAVDCLKDRRFASHIIGLSAEHIDRVKCWFPEDSLDVRFSLRDGVKFTPVEQGSPGQKTAALLAFILSYGNEPLILDQPEDDLDNELIYDLIVQQLRAIKHKRQVIVVTHNANIVVNGDSENIIALDIRAGQTQISAQGGLQELPIREQICRLMEGGTAAFEQRYRRINVHQDLG